MNNSLQSNYLRSQPSRRGAAMLLFIIFFTIAMAAFITMFSRLVLSDVRSGIQTAALLEAETAADAGVEDMAYRYIFALTPDSTETITVNGVTATTQSVFDSTADTYTISSLSSTPYADRTSQLILQVGKGVSFNFGVQTGQGGFRMTNGSKVHGNVFSNGTIEMYGGGNATINGDAISAGPSSLIDGIYATGTARARIVRNSTIDGNLYAYEMDGGIVIGNAYCNTLSGGAVTGSGGCLAYEPEEDPVDLPIPDVEIDILKQEIIDYGTVIASTDTECLGGEYFINTDTTLGWQKIECDLRVKKQGSVTTLTLTGPIWVTGDIVFEGGPAVEIDGSVGNSLVQIIADNPADRITSSRISVEQGTSFSGNGAGLSYILLLSQNEDAETGTAPFEDAIFMGQSSSGDLLVYAGHGQVRLGNSVNLKEVTGYLIDLGNSAEVFYESGLANSLFTSGPGGGYTIISWQDVD